MEKLTASTLIALNSANSNLRQLYTDLMICSCSLNNAFGIGILPSNQVTFRAATSASGDDYGWE